jgi:hypothetical protein
MFYTNKCIIVTINTVVLTALIVIILLRKTLIYLCYYYKHLLVNSVSVLSYPAVKVNLTNCLIKHQATTECEIMYVKIHMSIALALDMHEW